MASSQPGTHDDREIPTPRKPIPPKPIKLVSFSSTGNSGTARVLPDGHVKEFVALLRDGKIDENQPAQSSPLSVELLKINTWFQWLQSSIGADSLSITDTGGVLGFEIVLKPSTTTTTSPPFRFTSAGFSDALGVDLSSCGPGAVSGLSSNGETLMFGLDPTSDSRNLGMSLPEMFHFAGLHHLAKGLPFLGDQKLEIARDLKSGTVESHRNAIWFEPKDACKTVIRLQFTVPLKKIHEFFTKYLNGAEDTLKLTAAYVVVKKTLREMGWQPDPRRFSMEVNVTLVAKFTIQLKDASIDFSVALTFNHSSIDFDLVPQGPKTFENVLVWLATIVGLDIKTPLETAKTALGIDTFDITRISLTFATDQPKPIYFRLELRVVHHNAVFLFSYTWSGGGGKLKAELWPRSLMSALDADEPKLNSNWEEYLVFHEPNSEKLGLTSLFKTDNSFISPPSELGGHMSHLALEVSSNTINVYGRLSLQTTKSGFSFDSITFSGRYMWKPSKSLNVSFTVGCSLQGDHPEKPAYMTGEVRYINKEWTLSVLIENLSISALEKFLAGPSSSETMAFIGKLQIVSLDITYTFPSNFSSKGILRLGDFELDLTFTHHEGVCEFTANLHPTSRESTIGKVIKSITGSASLGLPSFVTDIKLGGDGGGDADIATVKFFKKDVGLFLVVSFHIGLLKFTSLQYRGAKSKVMKRVIKVSAQLPSFKIPMIDHPVQPFGELFFMWVYTKAEDTAPEGFTADEVKNINDNLPDKRDHLVFKKTADKANVSVIAEGLHFMLVSEETGDVTIDYVFQKSAKYDDSNTRAGGKKMVVNRPPTLSRDSKTIADTSEDPPGETHMAVYKRSIGPLSISNIGLQYKDDALAVHLDAELLLGPVGLSLLGLTVKITLNDKFNLQEILNSKIEASLDGMAVSFDQSPIEIAGLFKHTEDATAKSYGGGLIVGFDPYRFMAAGVYTKTLGSHEFKSVFVFGKLEGPLVVLEFAEISGITGGFGYNIHLKVPHVTDVLEFPFLNKDIPSDPQSALTAITNGGFFTPSEGSSWVAAGLTVKAFQALTIDAVVVVQWDPYVTLSIVGMAAMDVPKLKSNTDVKLLRIELGFIASVDFRSGVMKFEGQLTQNSYILSRGCHLTGGFAIYYWFAAAGSAAAKPSLEGDWVVTIGGYHRQFKPPAHYPKPPPRLGISWKVSNSISIIGEAYFAITPKVCMGGVRLHATISLGPLEAYFDAHADFLINFDPFHFIADIGISVGVKYTLDLWFVSHDITVEINAKLHLEGPPFSGTVYVDFYIVGFSIDFGPGAAKVEKANLERFYQLVVQDDGTKPKADGDHVLGCLSGMIADGPENDAPKHWNVRAGNFSFLITCRFPIKSVIGLGDDCFRDGEGVAPGSGDIYAKPMELTAPLSSIMTIHINKGITANPESLKWNVARVVKNVPSALWGIYDSSTDPMKEKHDPAAILKADNPTIPLTMGVTISAPEPRLPVEKSSAFDPAKQKPKDAFPKRAGCPDYPNFPDTRGASTQWQPEPEPDEQQLAAEVRWSRVSEKWRESTENEKTVSQWSKAFSWKATPKGKAALTGKAPGQLIKNFGNLYMVPPVLTMG